MSNSFQTCSIDLIYEEGMPQQDLLEKCKRLNLPFKVTPSVLQKCSAQGFLERREVTLPGIVKTFTYYSRTSVERFLERIQEWDTVPSFSTYSVTYTQLTLEQYEALTAMALADLNIVPSKVAQKTT